MNASLLEIHEGFQELCIEPTGWYGKSKIAKRILVNMLKPGEYFGNLSALGDDTYSEASAAQSDACIMSIGNR